MIVLQLNPVARKVMELLEPHIERRGFELIGVEYRKGIRSSILRLLIDRPEGGITLDDLEQLSPTLGDLLDVYDPVEGRYMLEVCSPGINRPLTKREHFEAHRGKRIRIRLRSALDGRKSFLGRLVSVGPEGIELDDEMSRNRQSISFGEMHGANYEHEFDR